jgi:hypothetical protein
LGFIFCKLCVPSSILRTTKWVCEKKIGFPFDDQEKVLKLWFSHAVAVVVSLIKNLFQLSITFLPTCYFILYPNRNHYSCLQLSGVHNAASFLFGNSYTNKLMGSHSKILGQTIFLENNKISNYDQRNVSIVQCFLIVSDKNEMINFNSKNACCDQWETNSWLIIFQSTKQTNKQTKIEKSKSKESKLNSENFRSDYLNSDYCR